MIVLFFHWKSFTYFFHRQNNGKIIQMLLFIHINLILARTNGRKNKCVFMVVTQCNLIPQTSIKNRHTFDVSKWLSRE